MSKKIAVGWASAHVGELLEDGIFSRGKQNSMVPAELMWCEPYDGAFVVKFFAGSETDEDMYVRFTASLTNAEGEDL